MYYKNQTILDISEDHDLTSITSIYFRQCKSDIEHKSESPKKDPLDSCDRTNKWFTVSVIIYYCLFVKHVNILHAAQLWEYFKYFLKLIGAKLPELSNIKIFQLCKYKCVCNSCFIFCTSNLKQNI